MHQRLRRGGGPVGGEAGSSSNKSTRLTGLARLRETLEQGTGSLRSDSRVSVRGWGRVLFCVCMLGAWLLFCFSFFSFFLSFLLLENSHGLLRALATSVIVGGCRVVHTHTTHTHTHTHTQFQKAFPASANQGGGGAGNSSSGFPFASGSDKTGGGDSNRRDAPFMNLFVTPRDTEEPTGPKTSAREEEAFEKRFREELEVQSNMRDRPDAKEGVAAFLEKREPNWN